MFTCGMSRDVVFPEGLKGGQQACSWQGPKEGHSDAAHLPAQGFANRLESFWSEINAPNHMYFINTLL